MNPSSLVTVVVAFALFVPAAEALLCFFGVQLFSFAEV